MFEVCTFLSNNHSSPKIVTITKKNTLNKNIALNKKRADLFGFIRQTENKQTTDIKNLPPLLDT